MNDEELENVKSNLNCIGNIEDFNYIGLLKDVNI
jgi:hypothetical protein